MRPGRLSLAGLPFKEERPAPLTKLTPSLQANSDTGHFRSVSLGQGTAGLGREHPMDSGRVWKPKKV